MERPYDGRPLPRFTMDSWFFVQRPPQFIPSWLNMDDAPSSTTQKPSLGEQLAQRLSDQRQRAEAFLSTHREEACRTLRHVCESNCKPLRSRLPATSRKFPPPERNSIGARRSSAGKVRNWPLARPSLRPGRKAGTRAGARQSNTTQSLLQQFQAEREDLEARRSELEHQRAELDQVQQRREKESRQFSHQQQELEAEQERLVALRTRLEGQTAELDEQQKAFGGKADPKRRFSAARSPRSCGAQRVSQLKEIERERAELESRDAGETGRLERQLKGVEQQRDALKAELAALTEEAKTRAHEVAEHERGRGRPSGAPCHRRFPLPKPGGRAGIGQETSGRTGRPIRNSASETRRKRFLSLKPFAHATTNCFPNSTPCEARWPSWKRAVANAAEREAPLREKLEEATRRQAELSAELDEAKGRAGEREAQLEASRRRQGELAKELETLRGAGRGILLAIGSGPRHRGRPSRAA